MRADTSFCKLSLERLTHLFFYNALGHGVSIKLYVIGISILDSQAGLRIVNFKDLRSLKKIKLSKKSCITELVSSLRYSLILKSNFVIIMEKSVLPFFCRKVCSQFCS